MKELRDTQKLANKNIRRDRLEFIALFLLNVVRDTAGDAIVQTQVDGVVCNEMITDLEIEMGIMDRKTFLIKMLIAQIREYSSNKSVVVDEYNFYEELLTIEKEFGLAPMDRE